MKRAAWILVTGVALALSNWSLAYVARSWGVEPWLSWLASAAYDGVALICAGLALKAARSGDSTFAPAAALFTFAGLSAWFNSWHAQLAGLPWAASVFYAVPPVAAVLVVELQLRSDRREALRAARRISDPLPAFGGAMWVNKPVASYRAVRKILRHRLVSKLEDATGQHARRPHADSQPVAPGSRSQVTAPRAGSKRSSSPGVQLAEQAIATALKDGQTLGKRTAAAKLNLHDVSEWQVQQILHRERAKLSSNGKP